MNYVHIRQSNLQYCNVDFYNYTKQFFIVAKMRSCQKFGKLQFLPFSIIALSYIKVICFLY